MYSAIVPKSTDVGGGGWPGCECRHGDVTASRYREDSPSLGGNVDLIDAIWRGIVPTLPWLVPLGIFYLLVSAPMPGRGPSSRARDPWRTFKFGARSAVMSRAQGRCEGSGFIAWGRCTSAAVEVDHVYPWSKGGATVISNGQALCSHHNRSKRDMTPPWWYLRALEARRRRYFPAGSDVRVFAYMSAEERAARKTSAARKRRF